MISELSLLMQRFAEMRVLVIGDLMVDEHIWGSAERISPEAPVMVVDAQEQGIRPGGAANVVNNVRALGAQASVVGIVGDDEQGRELVKLLASSGVDVTGIVADPSRCTTRKTRIWASYRQQVVRVDWEHRSVISPTVYAQIRQHIEREISMCDAVILSDYNKGMLSNEVAGAAISGASSNGRICACNAKPAQISNFYGADLLTVNQLEAESALGRSISEEANLADGGFKLLTDLGLSVLIITLGAKGLVVFERNGQMTKVAAVPIEVYDVAGAGDTVISTLALALASGGTAQQSARLANIAAGAVVKKIGVATTTQEEILQLLSSNNWSGS